MELMTDLILIIVWATISGVAFLAAITILRALRRDQLNRINSHLNDDK